MAAMRDNVGSRHDNAGSRHDNVGSRHVTTDNYVIRSWYGISVRDCPTNYTNHMPGFTAYGNYKCKDVFNNPKFPWHWPSMPKNRNIDKHDIRRIFAHFKQPAHYLQYFHTLDLSMLPPKRCDITALSENPSLTYSMVENTPFHIWNYEILSSNNGITIDDVLAHMDERWNFAAVVKTKCDAKKLLSHPKCPFDFQHYSRWICHNRHLDYAHYLTLDNMVDDVSYETLMRYSSFDVVKNIINIYSTNTMLQLINNVNVPWWFVVDIHMIITAI
jgi:hypothetical protein